jgi:hypothetical protein
MHGRLPGPIWLPAATAVGLAVAAPAVATAAVSVAVATAVGFAVAAPAVTAAAVTTAAVAAAAVITAAIVAAAVPRLRSHDVAGIQGTYLFYEVWRRVHCCCVPSRQWRELRKLLCTSRPIVRRFVGRQEQWVHH